MADTVAFLLESQIPELEDFEKRGYFDRSELKQIIKRRQDFEYLLKRRAALKLDYYRYIDYESKLEELRKMRKKSLKLKGKKTLADVAITRRIHFIYERATRKFKSDVQLWMRWIQYCKVTKSSKQLSKVATKALQRHGTVGALWMEAASWEFEANSNVGAARTLMQQGLRMCKHDETMWAEYARLELMYVQQLRLRRKVLGLDVPDAPLEGAETGKAGAPLDPEEAVQKVLAGAVVESVLKAALAALPNSLALRKALLAVLSSFNYPGVKAFTVKILTSLVTDFPSSEEAWDIQARSPMQHQLSAALTTTRDQRRQQKSAGKDSLPALPTIVYSPSIHKKVGEAYEQALEHLPTGGMYARYASYLGEVVQSLLEAGQSKGGDDDDESMGDMESLEVAATIGAQLLALMLRVHEAGVAGEDLYMSWIDWSAKLGLPKVALKASRLACQSHPTSAKLWHARINTELAVKGPKASNVTTLITSALTSVAAGEDSAGIWVKATEVLEPGTKDFAQLVNMLVTALAGMARGPMSGGMGEVAAEFLEKINSSQGIDAARTFVKRLLAMPSAGGNFFKAAIALEKEQLAAAQPTTSSKALDKRVIRIFEAAVDAYGSVDADLWLEYATHEKEMLRGAGQVYWRATKALTDPDDFVCRYKEVMQA